MSDYTEGHVKRDPATGAVAIRTNQPKSPPGGFALVQEWLAASTFAGARYMSTDDVDAWDDLFVPAVSPP